MRTRILLRALRWRIGATLVLLAVAVVAVGGAAIGPALVRDQSDSVLTSALDAGRATGDSVETITATGAGRTFARLEQAARHGQAVSGHVFEAPLITAEAGVDTLVGDQLFSSSLFSRTDDCDHLRIVSGACPRRIRQVLVSTRSAAAMGVRAGDALSLTEPGAGRKPRDFDVRVVGTYSAPTSVAGPYWEDRQEFDYGSGRAASPIVVDPLLATAGTVLSSARIGLQPALTADLDVRPGALRTPEAGTFQRSLARFTEETARRYGFVATSGLPGILAAFARDHRQITTVVAPFAVELVVLGLLVLYVLVALGARERLAEVEIAERRGFTRRGLFRVAAGDSLAVLIAAFPIGLAAAWATVAAVGSATFVSGTPAGLDGTSVLTGLVGLAGGIVAVCAGSLNLLRPPRRRILGSAGGGRRTALDGVAVALGAAGLLALLGHSPLSGSSINTVAILAPAMLAVGASVVVLRLAELAVQVLVRATSDSRRASMVLALRAVVRRRPSALRQILPLCVATATVVFAVLAWSVVTANRSEVARFETGAWRVDTVRLDRGVDLEQAVRRADPSGHQAMAAEVLHSSSNTLLAVDATRLAAVVTWPRDLRGRSSAAVASYLTPRVRAPIVVHGSTLRLTTTVAPGTPTVQMQVQLFEIAIQNEITITVGNLRPGTHTYTAGLEGACTSPCWLSAFSPTIADATYVGPIRVRLDALADRDAAGAWRALPLDGDASHGWAATPSVVRIEPGRAGVTFVGSGAVLAGLGVYLSPADVPDPIPAVLTSSLAPPVGSPAETVGLDGATEIELGGRVIVPALPGVGGDAALVDLGFAEREQVDPSEAVDQVWLSRSAGSAVVARLARQGVHVVRSTTAAERLAQLQRDPLGPAYRFALGAAPVAAALAIGAMAFVLAASARRRRVDLQALEVVGVPRATVARAGALETAVVVGLSLLVGVAVGVGTAALALRSLPELSAGNGGVPLGRTLPGVPLGLAVAGLAILLGTLVAAVSARGARREQ